MDSPRRLFIALPVNDERALQPLKPATAHLDRFGTILKIVPPENFHITVKFLGPVEPETAELLASEFRVLTGLKKVGYRIDGIGAFPSAGNPSVIWAGINCDEQALGMILQAVEQFTSGYGFVPEKRKFSPHLTLARIKKEKKAPADLKNFLKRGQTFSGELHEFRELVLFESFLKKTGPEYKKISVITLD